MEAERIALLAAFEQLLGGLPTKFSSRGSPGNEAQWVGVATESTRPVGSRHSANTEKGFGRDRRAGFERTGAVHFLPLDTSKPRV